MAIIHTVPKLPSIYSDKSLSLRGKKAGEPCFSLPEVMEYLSVSKGVFTRLRKENVIPPPAFYTGTHNKAYWHCSVIKAVKKRMDVKNETS